MAFKVDVWFSCTDRMMLELHQRGKTIEEIKLVLRRVPIHPRIVPAIKIAHALGCDLIIVSDANTLFIETILGHLGIKDCFSEINTNPSYCDDEGRLRISPYVDFKSSPHGCINPCPPNMCKGMIVERIKLCSVAKEGKKRMIYLGDGLGDFCPSLQLEEGDFMMPRKKFPAWNLIRENLGRIRAEIHEWMDGAELESILLQLIEKVRIQESAVQSALMGDCKFSSIPMAAVHHESRPLHVLRVHQ
ncbi:inorganic pyrophosphatase 1-like [Henckelia pumila]|uniref:inorganic pyrophosphatase 1-like n=1 Tax=Henckelia pumila TaxID=405737 RepID=UPI003C6E71CA